MDSKQVSDQDRAQRNETEGHNRSEMRKPRLSRITNPWLITAQHSTDALLKKARRRLDKAICEWHYPVVDQLRRTIIEVLLLRSKRRFRIRTIALK
uniref:Uncharacterized protein n=1 Tax=Glossina palpalis gambiensis TaxID=67801 RepID=A0A1B0BFL9_9MUSC